MRRVLTVGFSILACFAMTAQGCEDGDAIFIQDGDGLEDDVSAPPGEEGNDGGSQEADDSLDDGSDTVDEGSGDDSDADADANADEEVPTIELRPERGDFTAVDVTALQNDAWVQLVSPVPEVEIEQATIVIEDDTLLDVEVAEEDDTDWFAFSVSLDTTEGGFLTFRCATLADVDGAAVSSAESTYFISGTEADQPVAPACQPAGKFSITLPLSCDAEQFVVQFEDGGRAIITDFPPQLTLDTGDPVSPTIAVYSLDDDPSTWCTN